MTDWQYYATDPYSGERTEVSPWPMDPDQPARTRSSSGSLVRLLQGGDGGKLASKMRSRGLDPRILVKVRLWGVVDNNAVSICQSLFI